MRWSQAIVILIFTLTGFALRLYYAVTTHPFFDEYTTVLAARQILQHGWPQLPSGLFYEHGLLATYLITPFTALFINTPLSEWQAAHWGLLLSRWPSVLLGTLTIPVIFIIGRRGFKTQRPIPLIAAGLFALSPEGMVWGGRARMYALATLLVLLTVYWAYRGTVYPAPANYRWRAQLALLATLLTQFGALTLVPPLGVGMLVVGWISWQQRHHQSDDPSVHETGSASQPWFLRPMILLEATTLAAIIGLAVLIKRLGRPLGAETLSRSAQDGNLLLELFNSTIAYQATFHFTWADTVEFLARQFGVPHHFWLAVVTLTGGIIGLILWRSRTLRRPFWHGEDANTSFSTLFNLFLWLIFGLIIVEMVTLLEPFRRNPRYIVMYLPFFYLIAAKAVHYQLSIISEQLVRLWRSVSIASISIQHYLKSPIATSLMAVALVALFTFIGFDDLRIALLTPEPAYEEAFAHLHSEWQPGDAVLTMNTPAAGLYLGRADGFTVQSDADQFLLNTRTEPVDRWLGAPWVGQAVEFNAALNDHDRVWFVIDTIRQPVYFRGDWLAVLNGQMEQVWAKDNALIYRTRPDRTPLPTRPDVLTQAMLGDAIELIGFTLQPSDNQMADTGSDLAARASDSSSDQAELRLTLFWQPLTTLSTDYTTFLHLRNGAGATVAQRDRQPLDGAYPTRYWQPGETVIDPMTLPLPDTLPAGNYTLVTGLYHLDTLERLPVANDSSGENSVLLAEITLP